MGNLRAFQESRKFPSSAGNQPTPIFSLDDALAAFPLHFWNEWRAVTEANFLIQLRADTVEASPEKVDSANNGKPIYLTGEAVTDQELTDSLFNVSKHAIRISRQVEMWQWIEDEDEREDDDEPTYSYHEGWAEEVEPFDNPNPPHKNPGMPFTSQSVSANQVTLGKFKLSDHLISQIKDPKPLEIEAAQLPAQWKAKLIVDAKQGVLYYPFAARDTATNVGTPTPNESTLPEPSRSPESAPPPDSGNAPQPGTADSSAPPESAASPDTDGSSESSDPLNHLPAAGPPAGSSDSSAPLDGFAAPSATAKIPASHVIGDIQITYTFTGPKQTVSLISGQQDNQLTEYVDGRFYDREAEFLYVGTLSKEQIVRKREDLNAMMTWAIRAGGTALMFIGLLLVLRPLTAVANLIPIVGSIVGAGAFLAAGVVSVALSFITISISWIFVRPLFGVPLLLLGIAMIAGLVYLGKRKKAAQPPAVEPHAA